MTALDYVYCPKCAKTLEIWTEEERQIKFCPVHGKFYPKHDLAVGGIAVRFSKSGTAETLMVLRNKEPRKDLWSFPAGFVNYGEHPDDALVREVKEETGLLVVQFKLIEEKVSNDDPRSPNQQAKYYKMLVSGKIKNNDQGENSDIRWHSLHSSAPIPKIAWSNHDRLFEKMKERGGLDSFIREYGWLSHNVH